MNRAFPVSAPISPGLSLMPKGDQSALHIKVGQRLLGKGLLTTDKLAVAMDEQDRWGSHLGHVLLGKGMVRPIDYFRTLAEVLGTPFVNLQVHPVDPSLCFYEDRNDYASVGLIPWQRESGRVIIATTAVTPRQHEWCRERFGRNGYEFVITSPYDIFWQTQRLFREEDSAQALNALYSRMPEHSAKITMTVPQRNGLIALGILYLALWVIRPGDVFVGTMAVLTIFYLVTFLFKFLLTWVGANRNVDMQIADSDVGAIRDQDLPVYTVLVPMYREASVLPLLVNSLKGLDYPASKLDVKFILEEDDEETIAAAKELGMPASFEIVRVPHSDPKTKPKACNYALTFARGEFATIYDAEDMPEPDQLKKAVIAFRRSESSVACLQARLNYFNRQDNWLTRMFTLEYSQWFDFLLPGLDWLKVPIPLGGTSNHFRVSVLRQVGAWDPYNVTEDADLGVRFAQEGYTVGVINSTTYEEANGVLPSWIKQRSRWVKGYMQTWLVHMRHPYRLWQTIGPKGFLSFQLFVGGPPLVMLINPIFWLVTIVGLTTNSIRLGDFLPEPVAFIAAFNLIVGNLFLVYFGIIAALKRRYYDLVLQGILQPFYWVLHSVAAYKAAWQLVTMPHYWEKTEHGTSLQTKHALAQLGEVASGE